MVIREDTFHIFAHMQEMSHFINGLSGSTLRMPRIGWEGHRGEDIVIDGRLITMTALSSMYQELLKDTTAMLMEEVLLGLKLPDLTHDRIVDNLADTTIGYSFITDKRNRFHNHAQFLTEAMLDEDKFGTRFAYSQFSNEDGIMWNIKGIQDWYKTCEKCLGGLFGLYHYGSGQPARGTEITIISHINTSLHPRSIYWFSDFVNVVTTYNKTQTNQEKERVISRSLPPPVGELFIIWMTLVIPTLVTIAACMEAPRTESATRFRDLLFTSLGGPWDTDDLSSILMAISGEPVANYGLGHAMGVADTRHYLIGIMRKHLRGLASKDVDLLEEYFNEQSGHNDDVAENYALSFDTIQRVSVDHLSRFVVISRAQHKLVLPTSSSRSTSLPIASESRTYSHSSGGPQLDIGELSATMAPQLCTLMVPHLSKMVAEGYAAVTPINHHPSSSYSDASSKSPASEEARLGLRIVDVDRVQIAPARFAELYRLMGDGAVFKSAAQACLTELTAQRRSDILAVLGTGAGKSIAFMAAAVNTEETQAGLATVVIVPLVALLENLRTRLRNKGIKVMQWTNAGTTHYDARIILVSADIAASDAFLSYFLIGCRNHKVGRLIIDEIHLILTSGHYRPLLLVMARLREGGCIYAYDTLILPLTTIKAVCLLSL